MCHQESPCKQPTYQPSKVQLTHRGAIEAFESALKKTSIYHEADSYCRVCQSLTDCMFKLNVTVIFLSLVSGHLLGGVIQSSTAHLPPEAHSLWLQHLQNEDELGSAGLGTHVAIIMYIHVYYRYFRY